MQQHNDAEKRRKSESRHVTLLCVILLWNIVNDNKCKLLVSVNCQFQSLWLQGTIHGI